MAGPAGSRQNEMGFTPKIESVFPRAAIPGGDVVIRGSGFAGGSTGNGARPRVHFGEVPGDLLVGSDSYIVARVPDGGRGFVRVLTPRAESSPYPIALGTQVADNLHPVANPAVDGEGNIYVTFSGQRGQRVPVSLYKISSSFHVKPLTTELMNPTGLAISRSGELFVSCRHDGTIHKISPEGRATQWLEGMGIATGIAFDRRGFLYVGDRSGTIFKISPEKEIFVFATLEPSIAAYHLAFSPEGDLYVTGPTTSSFDRVFRISDQGEVATFYRGLGRPQGIAFDREGNVYVAASLSGRRGVVRITPAGRAEVVLSGIGIVGMALLPTHRAYLTTTSAIFSIDWDVAGMPLVG
jgi:sugar lactone lactonase YvrE